MLRSWHKTGAAIVFKNTNGFPENPTDGWKHIISSWKPFAALPRGFTSEEKPSLL
jgi:hypothetical protein